MRSRAGVVPAGVVALAMSGLVLAGCASFESEGMESGLAATCPGLDGVPTFDAEASCLKAVGPKARRDGPVLTLRPEQGPPVELTDRQADCGDDEDACVRYRLAGWIESSRLMVVAVGASPCARTLLVSSQTGEQVEVHGEPHLSQSGHRIVSVQGPAECNAPYDLAVWSAENGSIRSDWKYTSNKTSRFAYLGWEGDDRVLLTDTRDLRRPQSAKTYRAAATGGTKGWRLETSSKIAPPTSR